jgi:peptidoglycan/LPS O-acetylase OafA/YrhL
MPTFAGNILLAYGEAFSHSWSLCIDEQCYVMLALARWRPVLAQSRYQGRWYRTVPVI